MGVIYRLREDVVQYILDQRQKNPLASCRQLALGASETFGLPLSKSSVHDVLKASGVQTPRGRKPKDQFKIPLERKRQIQNNLAQVLPLLPSVAMVKKEEPNVVPIVAIDKSLQEAGKIFFTAARWDLGVFFKEAILSIDQAYYLTYSQAIKVVLENEAHFFIEMHVPLERAIREMADGLINNIRPLLVDQVSDLELFKAYMEAKNGFAARSISIVDGNGCILSEITNIVVFKRNYLVKKRLFVVSSEKNQELRADVLFGVDPKNSEIFWNSVLALQGFETLDQERHDLALWVEQDYLFKENLEKAARRLNELCLYDPAGRLLSVAIKNI